MKKLFLLLVSVFFLIQANTGPCGTFSWGEVEDYNVSIATKLHQDAGVVDIIQPTTMSSSSPTPIVVIIVNYGIYLFYSIDVSYQLNSGTPVIVTLTDTILPNDSLCFSFPAIVLPTGQNTICAYTTLLGDSNVFNDQHCITSFIQLLTPPPYFDNFEGVDYWLPDTIPNQWQRGVPSAQTINTAHSSSKVWMIQLNANYNNNSFDYLYTPKFNFGLISPDSLKFWHYYHTQSIYDGGHIQYFNNTGSWSTLGVLNDTNGTNWYNTTQTGIDMWTGNSNGWILSTYDLASVNDLANITQFRFIFASDNTINNYDGWAIDDFQITVPKVPNDGGVTAIVTPVDSTIAGNYITVQVTFKNFGIDTLKCIPVHYAITGQNKISETWVGNLLPNAITNFTFTTPYPGPYTIYEICAWTSITADTHTENDSTCKNIKPTPQYDAGVISIVNPNTSVHTGDTIYVQVKIKNFGTQSLTTIPVSYKIGNNLPFSDFYSGLIAPSDTVDFTFQQAFIAQSGSNNMCAWTTLANDGNSSNDSICIFFTSSSVNNIAGNFYENATSVNNQSIDSEFNFYPNPTSGKINIDLGKPYKTIDVTVKNVMGQEVLSKTYKSSNQLSFEIKGAKGVYFVEVRTDGKSSVFKVVKE